LALRVRRIRIGFASKLARIRRHRGPAPLAASRIRGLTWPSHARANALMTQPGTVIATAAPQRAGLFRKFVLSFVGIVSLVLLASGLLDGWFSYRETRQTLALVQLSKAEAAAQRIEQFVSEIERQIGWTTHAQWAAGTVDQRRFDYVRLLRQVPAITELVQLDGQGREQLKVSRLAMDVVGSNADYAGDARFREAQTRRIWYSPVYFRKESEPYMTIAVARSGRQAGVTLAEVNLKLIWDVVTGIRLGQTGYAYVVDRDARLIAHPDISLVLRNTDLSALPQVAAARAAPLPGDDDERATIVPSLDGRRVFSASTAIPQLGWYVFVETPVQEALEPLYATMLRTSILLLAGLATAALGGVLFARRMLTPVRALTEGAQRLGGGDLAHRIEVRTGDEIQGLAEGFNAMAGQLQQSYAGLEQRVADRTRELQEKSRQLEIASQHKSQFLANMSHELRTPLNAVLGYAELMADGVYGDLSPKAQGVLGRIQANGKHLLGLINDVLDLSKIEAGQFTLAIEPYSVGAVVQSVIAATESLASNKGIRLGAEIAADLPAGSGDERRLTQVLLNIVGNAIKFTDQGEVVIAARGDGEMFELAVRDTGPGIAPEHQAKIFGEFQQVDDSSTREKGGTGLGLTISKKIVEMHGGAISVDSELGKGSIFRVRIPMRAAPVREAAQ
jgi:two-component system, NtrC family, sensor kinase